MYQRFGKRLFDIIVSGLALIVLAPLMATVALAIWLEDGLPVLFRQERVGRFGKPFVVLKFRSMPVDTEDIPSAQAREIGVTRVGAIVRRLNTDELPQLFNIFNGDMAVVGPRPALAKQEALCMMREELGVTACKPGLTGLAQVNSYDDMPDTEKASWDAKYCNNVTFVRDVWIILRTFIYLLKPPPVY